MEIGRRADKPIPMCYLVFPERSLAMLETKLPRLYNSTSTGILL